MAISSPNNDLPRMSIKQLDKEIKKGIVHFSSLSFDYKDLRPLLPFQSTKPISGLSFKDSSFFQAQLSLMTFFECDFSYCDMRKVKAEGARFRDCIFRHTDLGDADLNYAVIEGSYFFQVNMEGAKKNMMCSDERTYILRR